MEAQIRGPCLERSVVAPPSPNNYSSLIGLSKAAMDVRLTYAREKCFLGGGGGAIKENEPGIKKQRSDKRETVDQDGTGH